jgi:hypothetical protein
MAYNLCMSHSTQCSLLTTYNELFFVPDISYPLESVPSTASQTIHTRDPTSEVDVSLAVLSTNVTQERDSAADATEEHTLSAVSPAMPVKVSNTYETLVQDEDGAGLQGKSILVASFNGNASAHYSDTLLSENGSEAPSDHLAGTYPENSSDVMGDMYHNSPPISDKQTANITTGNFSHHLEISAEQGEYNTVRDQLTNISAEEHSVYPAVTTEDAYIVLQEFIGGPTEHPPTQSNLLFINYSEVSNVGTVSEKSEGQCTDSYRNSTQNVYEKSKTPTEVSYNTSDNKQPELTKEQPIKHGGGRLGKLNITSSASSRHVRDNWGDTERLLETSKGKSPGNVRDIQYSASTTDSPLVTSSGQLRMSVTKFPDASSGTTETASRNQGGQLISISVENPSRYYRTNSSTRRFDTILRTTTGRSSSSSSRKFPSAGE